MYEIDFFINIHINIIADADELVNPSGTYQFHCRCAMCAAPRGKEGKEEKHGKQWTQGKQGKDGTHQS